MRPSVQNVARKFPNAKPLDILSIVPLEEPRVRRCGAALVFLFLFDLIVGYYNNRSECYFFGLLLLHSPHSHNARSLS